MREHQGRSVRYVRTRAVSLIFALSFLFVGCGASGGGAPESPDSEMSSTPTPTPTIEFDLAAVVPFDGDCANVVSDAAALVGGEVTASPDFPPEAIATLGGIGCHWFSANGTSLSVYVAPEHLVPGPLIDRFTAGGCELSYDWQECHLSGSSGGMWALVSMPSLDERGTPPPSIVQALDEVLGSVSGWPAGVPAVRTDEWWEPIDCEQLGADIDVTALMAGTEFYAGYPTDSAPHPISEMIDPAGVSQWCPWFSYDLGGIWMNLYPGARFQWDLLEGAPTTVAGAEAAVLTEVYGTTVLAATDGTNIVTVQEAPIPLEELAAQVLAALNG